MVVVNKVAAVATLKVAELADNRVVVASVAAANKGEVVAVVVSFQCRRIALFELLIGPFASNTARRNPLRV